MSLPSLGSLSLRRRTLPAQATVAVVTSKEELFNDGGANIGVKQVSIRKVKTKDAPPFNGAMQVGDMFPVNQGVLTFMEARFLLTDDDALEDSVNEFMADSDAIPERESMFTHVYLSKDFVLEQYNTLIVVTTAMPRGKQMIFSISLAQTNQLSSVSELVPSIDFYTLDFYGYRYKLLKTKGVLTDKLKRTDGLLSKLPVVIRAEIVISQEELAFLSEPDPVDDPVDSAIKKRLPKPRKPRTSTKKRASKVVPGMHETPPRRERSPSPAPEYSPQTVEEFD